MTTQKKPEIRSIHRMYAREQLMCMCVGVMGEPL